MRTIIQKIINFFDDDILYYSASLSFFTIFSFLPILALLIVIISSISISDINISLFITYVLSIINPIHSGTLEATLSEFLSNTNKLGFIGIVYFLIIFTLFFNNYEYIVNKIYNTKKRPIYKMFVLYICFLIFMPILFIFFIFISSFAKGNISMEIITFLFTWSLFSVVFQVSVTALVSFRISVIGSFITLLVLVITKKLFTFYIIYNTAYITIYGSFSIILFFFLWIYISWTIFLYGMKLTYIINSKYNKVT
ncbi:Inner membrane protein YihY, formerly thought to be RNase BN [hydrothermal vent metagenome]|uniref:Inner membrane protein YihY, formerly thought to be RNase BN n=1 Tax=hydrothermal vent metagenome TaxID=652676 RepID=A0A3B1DXX1_9ZZZZ